MHASCIFFFLACYALIHSQCEAVQGRCSTPSLLPAPDGVTCTTPVLTPPVGYSALSIDGNNLNSAWISTLVLSLAVVAVTVSVTVTRSMVQARVSDYFDSDHTPPD